MFYEQFNENDDVDERQLRLSIQLLTQPMTTSQRKTASEVFKNSQKNINDSKPPTASFPTDESAAEPKALKLSANMYTISFSAFMRSNKEKFRLRTDDQVDLLYRALFMAVIQLTFLYTVLTLEMWNTDYKDDTILNLCLFFTVLILHWQCLPEARNGIYMMKYALCNPGEFTHPFTAFCLGFLQIFGVWLTEIANLYKSLDQKKPSGVIQRFVGFALILNVPKLMISSMEVFEVQKSVAKLMLLKGRKAAYSEAGYWMKMPAGALLHPIYWLCKRFYTGLYFYFFPFVVILIPMFKLTYLANVQ